MNSPNHTTEIHAAGTVPWRLEPDGNISIALVHRPRYNDWSLPKGKIKASEIAPACAVRETQEETGLTCALGHRIDTARYSFMKHDQSLIKKVQYFSARVINGTFISNSEVDAIKWMSTDKALEKLSYTTDQQVVRKFSLIPHQLHLILLVRHAHAGDAEEWQGEDKLRPLSDHGWRQAQALGELLPLFQPEQVFSAPLSRCLQTMQPFVEKTHVPLQREYLFSEAGYWPNSANAYALISHIANQWRSSVICSQGGVIPDLVHRIAQHGVHHGIFSTHKLGDIPSMLERPRSKKSSAWALFFTTESGIRPRLVTADYYSQAT